MFQNLKNGSQLWILHSGTATPFVEVGTVETTNSIMPMMYYPNMPTYPLDVTVKVGEKIIPFKGLPMNAESATVTDQTTREVVTIACSKDAISTEIDSMAQKSAEVINSVDYHKNRLMVCAELKKQLNPEIAEKEAQAKLINDLQEELRMMKEQMAEMKAGASS